MLASVFLVLDMCASMLISNLCSQAGIACWAKIRPSRLAIFPESGRAKAGDGDLLEQVRGSYDG